MFKAGDKIKNIRPAPGVVLGRIYTFNKYKSNNRMFLHVEELGFPCLLAVDGDENNSSCWELVKPELYVVKDNYLTFSSIKDAIDHFKDRDEITIYKIEDTIKFKKEWKLTS